LRVARRYNLPVSVRGGGHDWTGRALCSDGLVIDLTRIREVVIDPRSRVAIVSGGTSAKDLATAAGAHCLISALPFDAERSVHPLELPRISGFCRRLFREHRSFLRGGFVDCRDRD
jgi:FAD/FMN-containing dehydrogenase